MDKKIVFLLDTYNMAAFISNEKLEQLINYLELYQKKFACPKLEIVLTGTIEKIKSYINLISPKLKENMIIRKCLFYEGIYDNITGNTTYFEENNIYDKVLLLDKYCLDDQVKFLVVFDSELATFRLAKFKENMLVSLFTVSTENNEKSYLKYKISIHSLEGVVDCFKKQWQDIQNLSYKEIHDKQKNEKTLVDTDYRLQSYLWMLRELLERAYIANQSSVNSLNKIDVLFEVATDFYSVITESIFTSLAQEQIKEFGNFLLSMKEYFADKTLIDNIEKNLKKKKD